MKLNFLQRIRSVPQYVFCINTGRAGSQYLSTLLDTNNNVLSLHEPQPQMIDEYLMLATNFSYKETYTKRKFKAGSVIALRKKAQKKVYAETNHMFIKTFYDVVCEELPNVMIIQLKRDFLDTLKSFADLRYFSDRNLVWPKWMISPNAVTKAINCIDNNDKNLDFIDLSIAYLIDIEARAERFKKEYPNIPFLSINISDINNMQGISYLFDWLGLEVTKQTKEFYGKKENSRTERKKQFGEEIKREMLIERMNKYYRMTKKQYIKLPESIEEYFIHNA